MELARTDLAAKEHFGAAFDALGGIAGHDPPGEACKQRTGVRPGHMHVCMRKYIG